MQKKLGIKNEKKSNNEKATADCIPPAISRGFFVGGIKKTLLTIIYIYKLNYYPI